jgi:predicted transposase/invertase (TIGR01784 family)
MSLGIRPIVDFAFKKIFGSPDNSRALIGLLNAILELEPPIEEVQILNPFNYQEFAESKLIVLDIRCRDSSGKWINVEMQIANQAGFLQRSVYYSCSMYVDQLQQSDQYSEANSAISICLISKKLFTESDQAHHRFQMMDYKSGRRLADAIEVHTIELAKYNLDETLISSRPRIEQWAFLLLRAQDYDRVELRKLLPEIEFQDAIRVLEIISSKTEDKQMYDQREKAQRDYIWMMTGARQEGFVEGKEQGLEEGREQGIEEGIQRGKLAGKIQFAQELLGQTVSTDQELTSQNSDILTALLDGLRKKLKS